MLQSYCEVHLQYISATSVHRILVTQKSKQVARKSLPIYEDSSACFITITCSVQLWRLSEICIDCFQARIRDFVDGIWVLVLVEERKPEHSEALTVTGTMAVSARSIHIERWPDKQAVIVMLWVPCILGFGDNEYRCYADERRTNRAMCFKTTSGSKMSGHVCYMFFVLCKNGCRDTHSIMTRVN
jgi:hypothetical protein